MTGYSHSTTKKHSKAAAAACSHTSNLTTGSGARHLTKQPITPLLVTATGISISATATATCVKRHTKQTQRTGELSGKHGASGSTPAHPAKSGATHRAPPVASETAQQATASVRTADSSANAIGTVSTGHASVAVTSSGLPGAGSQVPVLARKAQVPKQDHAKQTRATDGKEHAGDQTAPARPADAAASSKPRLRSHGVYEVSAALSAHKERRRLEVYVLNALLHRSDEARVAALLRDQQQKQQQQPANEQTAQHMAASAAAMHDFTHSV